jgi:hypothetical protein
MATEVKCPSCGFGFPIEEVMAEEYKKNSGLKCRITPAKRRRIPKKG